MTISNPILLDLLELLRNVFLWCNQVISAYFMNMLLSVAFAIFIVKRVSKLFDIIR